MGDWLRALDYSPLGRYSLGNTEYHYDIRYLTNYLFDVRAFSLYLPKNSFLQFYGCFRHGKSAPKPAPWAQAQDNGAWAKAALLSGPPGVGKTTTAYLVAKVTFLFTNI